MVPLIKQLQDEHPIVGWIEDPIVSGDLEGWAALKRESSRQRPASTSTRIQISRGCGPGTQTSGSA